MGTNPEALQEDIGDYFKELHADLCIERLQAKGRKDARDDKKKDLRSGKPGISITPGKLPQRTGDFDQDADAFFASRNIE